MERSADQRVVEAAAQLPCRGGVTGWAALRWAGGTWFTGIDVGGQYEPVHVAVGSGHRLRPKSRLVVSNEVVHPSEFMKLDGVRITSVLWSLGYQMRKARSDEAAVAAFDMAAFNDLTSIDELAEYVEPMLVTRWGVGRVRRVLGLLDENAWSPLEPVLRMTWELHAERPRPLTNRPVFDLAGRFVGTPDVIDPRFGVVGEYDGSLHLAGDVRAKDVRREAEFRRLGLEPVVMVAGDLADRGRFIARLHEAYARAARRPAADRQWTLTPPSWWLDTTSVAARRALSAYDRERLLTHRRRAA